MIRTRTGRLLAGLSAAALVGGGLGACSAQPGVALQVGDTTFTEADITQAAEQYEAMTGSSVDRYQYVWSLSTIPAFLDAAESQGVSVDDATLDADLQSLVDSQSLTEVPDDLSPALREILRYQFVYSELSSSDVDPTTFNAAYDAAQKSIPVTVSPRYGSAAPTSSTEGVSTALADVVSADSLASDESGSTGPDGGTSQSGD
ncbi:MAG: hypothetical protein LKI58_01455 [Actinomyces sp.]|nr:hypothetical protein [Actinomyces sp.]MCI1641693.1 hypothetical protein [Actinomyces sp.]MCI1661834.1 hypothetical protein [Actinomyces sp.]MCI1690676.1 hypothetical protein [Actinomyces sp.]MCI1786724.1 hypothetical protein [Actinomyces sp.]MCI1829134.1 hypothetical protein [Actinomyces sp.]